MDNKKKMKAMIKQMQSVIALVIIFVVASTICIKDGRNNFLDIRNLMNVLRAVSENGIIAIGMTIILILGDIDLSVGSVVGLISTGCAYLMVKSGLGFVPAILVSLGIGALFGLFNGLCIKAETSGFYRYPCIYEYRERTCKILGKRNRYPACIWKR